jgi:hypothetical protein
MICKAKDQFPAENIAERKIKEIREKVGDKKVLIALSGGSDSGVVAGLLKKALGKKSGKIRAIYIKGIDRPDDEAGVIENFGKEPWIEVRIIDATREFLKVLKGKFTMPEKRIAIRIVYKEVLEKEIKKLNPRANIIKANFAKVDQNLLFGIYSKKEIEKEIKHEHTKNVEYFTFESSKSIDKAKFEDLIKKLPKEVYRLKGFIKLDNKFYLINYVAQKYSLDEFKAEKTQLVFIGENINKVKENILKQLNSL